MFVFITGVVIDEPLRVSPLGGVTTFTCLYIPLNGTLPIHWIVNGTWLEDLEQRDGIEVVDLPYIGHLNFINISVEHNDTTIQCRVDFTSGEIVYSNNATLFVQGAVILITCNRQALVL